jgi:hypothetical protein
MPSITQINGHQAALRRFAAGIHNGNVRPYGERGLYEATDWIAAADYLLHDEGDDYSEMEFMLAREAAWERFEAFCANRRRDYDFETWVDAYAPEASRSFGLQPRHAA